MQTKRYTHLPPPSLHSPLLNPPQTVSPTLSGLQPQRFIAPTPWVNKSLSLYNSPTTPTIESTKHSSMSNFGKNYNQSPPLLTFHNKWLAIHQANNLAEPLWNLVQQFFSLIHLLIPKALTPITLIPNRISLLTITYHLPFSTVCLRSLVLHPSHSILPSPHKYIGLILGMGILVYLATAYGLNSLLYTSCRM